MHKKTSSFIHVNIAMKQITSLFVSRHGVFESYFHNNMKNKWTSCK